MKKISASVILILTLIQVSAQNSLEIQGDTTIVILYDKPAFDFLKWYTPLIDSVGDIDGNYYQTIRLGEQVWMKQNLRVTKYNNGKSISFLPDSSDWINTKRDGYSIYFDKSTHPRYFYNYKVVNNSSNICPCGWRVPDSTDWQILEDYANVVNRDFCDGNGVFFFVENDTIHLRKERINIWESEIKGLSFSNQAFGYRSGTTGEFLLVGDFGNWWSVSGKNNASAWARIFVDRELGIDDIHITNIGFSVGIEGKGTNVGLSIRCIKE